LGLIDDEFLKVEVVLGKFVIALGCLLRLRFTFMISFTQVDIRGLKYFRVTR